MEEVGRDRGESTLFNSVKSRYLVYQVYLSLELKVPIQSYISLHKWVPTLETGDVKRCNGVLVA